MDRPTAADDPSDVDQPSAAYLAVTVTAPSAEEASALATTAVQRRLAACAQVSGPISSTYWWDGALTTAREWVCTFKTTGGVLDRLVAALREVHSYDLPEIVAVPLGGDRSYLRWIDAETGAGA